MNYKTMEVIRNGYLPIRRWSKRVPILLGSANLWLDHLITQLLISSKEVITRTSSFTGSISEYETVVLGSRYRIGKYVAEFFSLEDYLIGVLKAIDILLYLLFFISILFWVRMLASLLFVYVDFRLTHLEKGKRQFFILFAVIFNIIVYYLLADQSTRLLNFQ